MASYRSHGGSAWQPAPCPPTLELVEQTAAHLEGGGALERLGRVIDICQSKIAHAMSKIWPEAPPE